MDEVARIARETKPKLIICGGTAYSRGWDWARFREIADEIGAYLMADMSHISGLVAGGAHSSPVPHAHVTTTTTHKSLRGPRSGVILSNDEALAKKFNSAIFPGLQGGPLVHVIAAKAVCFADAMKPEFKSRKRGRNAKALASSLQEQGLDIVSGGTDNHLMLVDLRPKQAKGKHAEHALDRASITCNKTAFPSIPKSRSSLPAFASARPQARRAVSACRIPPDRPHDRRCCRRLAAQWRSWRRSGRGADQARSRGTLRALPNLSLLTYKGDLPI